MPGSFDFTPAPDEGFAEIDRPVVVFLYNPDAPPPDEGKPIDGAFIPIPNVVCDQIEIKDGAHFALARFHYILDDNAQANDWPTDFDELFPVDAQGPYVVQPDDRLVVVTWTPLGNREILFDGFAQIPQMGFSPTAENITFVASDVACRLWDETISGRYQRTAANTQTGAVYKLDLPTRFNPTDRDGIAKPNCTPVGYEENHGDTKTAHPVFLDENLRREPPVQTLWTLSGAVRYLLARWNPQDADPLYVVNPDFSDLDALLKVRKPKEGEDFFDPSDPSTYDDEEIVIRDYDATNKPVLEAVADLLGFHGFSCQLRLETGEDERPTTRLEIYRKDADPREAPRKFYLNPTGTKLKPGLTNAVSASLVRDVNGVVNEFAVESAQRKYEVSIVLAPGFSPAIGDESAANRSQFVKANLAGASGTTRAKYRVYVADEAADGHWDEASNTWKTDRPLDLSSIFPDEDGEQTYCERLRPGRYELISRDTSNKPLRAQLALSRDYTGEAPAVWDGTGTWQPISGGWKLLEDRLGIEVTIEDPEKWHIGEYSGADPQEKSHTLRGVTSQANPTATSKRFYLRLTTVIEDDFMLKVVAEKRMASPTKFARRRTVDARDHFTLEAVAAKSLYNSTDEDVVPRNDSLKAMAHAEAHRAVHEFPALAGSISIKGIDTAVRIGDRVEEIAGREVTLRRNIATDQDEAPSYPVVVAKTFILANQTTAYQLSDRRAEPDRA